MDGSEIAALITALLGSGATGALVEVVTRFLSSRAKTGTQAEATSVDSSVTPPVEDNLARAKRLSDELQHVNEDIQKDLGSQKAETDKLKEERDRLAKEVEEARAIASLDETAVKALTDRFDEQLARQLGEAEARSDKRAKSGNRVTVIVGVVTFLLGFIVAFVFYELTIPHPDIAPSPTRSPSSLVTTYDPAA